MAENPDLAAQDYLHNADDTILACRGQAHNWPKVRPSAILPKGLRISGPYRDGVFELIFTCRDCGMERRLITAARGELELPARYAYRQPEGYKAPKGSGITRRDCLAETWRRSRENYMQIAARQQKVTQ